VAALCNRGGVTAADLDVPALVSLVELSLDSWEAADCPLCRAGVPVNTDVGKGREFLAARA
jgi:orotate phosphoribosyltransferase